MIATQHVVFLNPQDPPSVDILPRENVEISHFLQIATVGLEIKGKGSNLVLEINKRLF